MSPPVIVNSPVLDFDIAASIFDVTSTFVNVIFDDPSCLIPLPFSFVDAFVIVDVFISNSVLPPTYNVDSEYPVALLLRVLSSIDTSPVLAKYIKYPSFPVNSNSVPLIVSLFVLYTKCDGAVPL